MYIYALYIGLVATAVSYLYFVAIPFYAQQINEGAEADELLWFRAIHQSYLSTKSKSKYKQALYALGFGLLLSLSVLYHPWLPQGNLLLNTVVMSVWLGALWLAARVDFLCYLLPDVLTQLLLWLGLLVAWQQGSNQIEQALMSAVIIYVTGRVINTFGFFCFGHALFGHGDVKLVAAVAAWLGINAVVMIFFWACVLCFVLEGLRQRRWRPSGLCAFGPHLVLATLVVWLV